MPGETGGRLVSLLRGGLIAGYLNHSLLVGIAWLRFLLFAFFVGALLALYGRFPGWEPLAGLALAFGLYNGIVALLIQRGKDDTARWIGGAFDTLTVMVSIYVLSASSAQNSAVQNLVKLPLFFVIPLSLVHFGLLVGMAISAGVLGWYYLTSNIITGPPEGMGAALIQAPALIVIGGLVTAISRNLQQERRLTEQARLRQSSGSSGSGAVIEHVLEVPPSPAPAKPTPASERIRVYIAEESYLLKRAYEYVFRPDSGVEIVDMCGASTGEELVRVAQDLKPHVMLLGFNILDRDAVDRTRMLLDSCPDVALVVLCARYNEQGLAALRKLCMGNAGACAYLLKNSVDEPEQLVEVVKSVARGRVILDPPMMEALIAGSESPAGMVKDLTPAEMKVLSWIAKGYNDEAISHVLGIGPEKMRRHVNSIHQKLGLTPGAENARVHAATLFLKATGLLSPDSRSPD